MSDGRDSFERLEICKQRSQGSPKNAMENVRVSHEAAATLFDLPNLTSRELCIDDVDGDDRYPFVQNRPAFHLEV